MTPRDRRPFPVRRWLRAGAPAALVLAATSLAGCHGGSAGGGRAGAGSGLRTYHGEPVRVGEGTARTYVTVDGEAPVEVGIALSEGALEGLPAAGDPGAVPSPEGYRVFELVLPMPERNPTPFRHATLDWNPEGHEPPHVYTTPHFDFHFFLIPDAARRAIAYTDPEFEAKAARHPAPEYLPEGYFAPPKATVPGMGVHWLHRSAGELAGEPFAASFLYGTWNGAVVFFEPMITLELLRSRPSFSVPVGVPARQTVPGFHPTFYAVRWDPEDRVHRVSLGGFAPRTGP